MNATDTASRRPEVSVVIPTRDRRERLLGTLARVRAQRGPVLEIVVVDDGSADGTAAAVVDLRDRRIRLVRNPRSLGLAGARNAGIRAAEGEWIAFLDDDDLWVPVKLGLQLRAAAAAGTDWCYGAAAYVDDGGRLIQLVRPPAPATLATTLRGHNAIPAGASNVIVRSRLLEEVGAFDEDLQHFADWDLWLRLTARATPAAVPAPLLSYVHHASNMRLTEPSALTAELRRLDRKHGLAGDREPGRFKILRWIAAAQWHGGRRAAAARTTARLLRSGAPGSQLRWLLPRRLRHDSALRAAGALAAVAARATVRPAGAAVVYHRVAERAGSPGRRANPALDSAQFEGQIAHLARWYRPVTASALAEAVASRRRWRRIPIAITFDDDERAHLDVCAPILRRHGVPATFFLTGAALERPFSPWWDRLDRALDAGMDPYDEAMPPLDGVDAPWAAGEIDFVAEAIRALDPDARDRLATRLLERAGPDPETAGLRAADVRALRTAGFEIGFHTLRHDSLADLDDARLGAALSDGREALARAAGDDAAVIAYPHGRADRRVAQAVRDARFRAAFTTDANIVTPATPRELLPRFAPSYDGVGRLSLAIGRRLWRGGAA